MRLHLATNNAHKAAEIANALRLLGSNAQVLNGAALGGMPEVEETEDSLPGNARLKARALWERSQPRAWVFADDTGLHVDALGGAPGVHTARYAGPEANAKANIAKLLRELEGVPPERRGARFVCCLLLLDPEGNERIFEGVLHGAVAEQPSGAGGFGYDPIFIPRGYEVPMAELDADEKDRISHRAQAVRQLAQWLGSR